LLAHQERSPTETRRPKATGAPPRLKHPQVHGFVLSTALVHRDVEAYPHPLHQLDDTAAFNTSHVNKHVTVPIIRFDKPVALFFIEGLHNSDGHLDLLFENSPPESATS
jgi:hypothetical protein